MSIQHKFRSTALRAITTVAIVEYTTHLPSEGRSSIVYHRFYDEIITPLGRRFLDPEDAHHLALDVVRRGWAPRLSWLGSNRDESKVNMMVEIIGASTARGDEDDVGEENKQQRRKLQFPGPIGLAAGFDKDGIAIPGLFDLGFSFVEIGSVTPLPQPGNPRPRSFRLVEDRGVINRYGFNSQGADKVRGYLSNYRRIDQGRGSGDTTTTIADYDMMDEEVKNEQEMENEQEEVPSNAAAAAAAAVADSILSGLGWVWNRLMTTTPRTGVLGVNLGKNKTSEDEVGDYTIGIQKLGPYADYLVINVSSPNTPGLRSLQQREPLRKLLSATLKARDEYAPHALLFVKISPDMTLEEMEDVANVVMETGTDGMIVTNTTNARPEILSSKHRKEIGGLSGAPIKDKSTECIRTMYQLTDGKVPIIGVGGIGSGRDAYDKLKAGASLVQIYSMMVYEGPGVVSRIRKELADIIVENGYKSVDEVVGSSVVDIYWSRCEERVQLRMKEQEEEKLIID